MLSQATSGPHVTYDGNFTIFAYDCRMRFLYRAHEKSACDFHDIKLPVATIVVGF